MQKCVTSDFTSAGPRSKKATDTGKGPSLTNPADVLKKIEVRFSSHYKNRLRKRHTSFCLLQPFHLLSLKWLVNLAESSPAYRVASDVWTMLARSYGGSILFSLLPTCQLASPSIICLFSTLFLLNYAWEGNINVYLQKPLIFSLIGVYVFLMLLFCLMSKRSYWGKILSYGTYFYCLLKNIWKIKRCKILKINKLKICPPIPAPSHPSKSPIRDNQCYQFLIYPSRNILYIENTVFSF